MSLAGIFFNLLLFALKLTAGALSGSVAITADGFNNLADSGSCVLALLGIKLGSKPPDKKYPYGRGRLEYLSGMLISAAVLFIGGRMLVSSAIKIIRPQPVDGCPAVIVILMLSVAVKGYMYAYNSKIGRLIHSSGMKAAALDSMSDCISTMAILAAIVIEKLTGFNADGYTGVLVAVCILYAGLSSVKESVAPMLGKAPDRDLTDKLRIIISRYPQIKRVDDVALHDYGPHTKLLTFFIDCEEPHEVIGRLKEDICCELKCEAVICPIYKKASKKNNPESETNNKDEEQTGA